MSENKPIIAFMYDFDKTLCTKDMQEYTFIPNLGTTSEEFWKESGELAKENKMDGILAYMYIMREKARSSHIPVRRDDFVKLGKDLEFFPGVPSWFDRINRIGEEQEVIIEHYIISSGLREIIEGSSIYDKFHAVFACEFFYDENNVACWPKNVVNYTTKTQFLYRVNKGVLDLSKDEELNQYTPEDDRRIPFRNMVYIGDGITDVPCMKLVKVNGGYSIAVYQEGKKSAVTDFLHDNRVNYIEPADYSEGSPLENIARDIIRQMAIKDSLVRQTKAQLKEIGRG